jgi:hypothetical protein
MDTQTRALTQRQFPSGLANRIVMLAIAGGFWSGLAASTLPGWIFVPMLFAYGGMPCP